MDVGGEGWQGDVRRGLGVGEAEKGVILSGAYVGFNVCKPGASDGLEWR